MINQWVWWCVYRYQNTLLCDPACRLCADMVDEILNRTD